jgi:uncharacterized protein (TIGR03435 family)
VPDITARADQPVAEPQLLTMLQPLLADRFKLTLHRETRQVAFPLSTFQLSNFQLTLNFQL